MRKRRSTGVKHRRRKASEAIAVIDIVHSTATSDTYGWDAVGRGLFADLRKQITALGGSRGLRCMKSTGDGYLLAFADARDADRAAVNAIIMAIALLDRMSRRNRKKPKEKRINLRVAVHFGEVDVLSNDREGPNVSYAFRLEAIDRSSLPGALAAISPQKFPLKNYILCSERVREILRKHGASCSIRYCGLFKLKGFEGRRNVYLVIPPRRATPHPR